MPEYPLMSIPDADAIRTLYLNFNISNNPEMTKVLDNVPQTTEPIVTYVKTIRYNWALTQNVSANSSIIYIEDVSDIIQEIWY